MATKWDEPARDALDTMTHSAADLDSLRSGEKAVTQTDYMPFDPTIKRTEGTVTVTATGKSFKCTKGAPNVLMDLCQKDGIIDQQMKEQVEKDVHRFGTCFPPVPPVILPYWPRKASPIRIPHTNL